MSGPSATVAEKRDNARSGPRPESCLQTRSYGDENPVVMTAIVMAHLGSCHGGNLGLSRGVEGQQRRRWPMDGRVSQQESRGHIAPPRGGVWSHCPRTPRTAAYVLVLWLVGNRRSDTLCKFGSHSSRGAGVGGCSTPFGINGTDIRSLIMSARATFVLNAFRHQRNRHR